MWEIFGNYLSLMRAHVLTVGMTGTVVILAGAYQWWYSEMVPKYCNVPTLG